MNTHVQMTKVGEVPSKYKPKAHVGYTTKGLLLASIREGEPIRLQRYEKNGEPATGVFTSSEVTNLQFQGDKLIATTNNSVYEIVNILPKE